MPEDYCDLSILESRIGHHVNSVAIAEKPRRLREARRRGFHNCVPRAASSENSRRMGASDLRHLVALVALQWPRQKHLFLPSQEDDNYSDEEGVLLRRL